MTETNKVVLAAILGIIIGFGFGRFSYNREAMAPGTETATTTESAPAPRESSVGTTPAQAPSTAMEAVETSEAPSAAASVAVSALAVEQQTSKTAAVSALDQKAGMSVEALASVDRFVWVAVHEQTDGKPERILGAVHFDKGTANVTVPLKRGTVRGGTYYVMLHGDDGMQSDFSLTADLPLLGANGKPIMVMFKAL